MARNASWLAIAAALACSSCDGDEESAGFRGTIKLAMMLPGSEVFLPYRPAFENGHLAALKAVNDAGGIRDRMKVESVYVEGVGGWEMLGGSDETSLAAEMAAAEQTMAEVDLPLMLGPHPHWPDQAGAHEFCTSRQIVCISGTSGDVRTDANKATNTYSFTTASTYPGWLLGTVYDMKQAGHGTFLFAANWDTSVHDADIAKLEMTSKKLQLPNIEDDADWGDTPASEYAQQIMAETWDSLLLATSEKTNVEIFSAMKTLGFNASSAIWLGDQQTFESFVSTLGDVGASGIRKTSALKADTNSASYKTFLDHFKALTNDQPEMDEYEQQLYAATLVGLYAAHATESDDGAVLRQKLIEVTSPPGEKLPLTEVETILDKIGAGEDVDVEGFGVSFGFSDDAAWAGKSIGDLVAQECCDSGGQPKGTDRLGEAVVDDLRE